MHRLLTIAATLLLLPSTPIVSAEGPLRIGLMAELSGSNAANGQSCLQGYKIAQSVTLPQLKAKGRHVEFVYGDHKGEPAVGVSEFSRMSSVEGVSAVITTRAQVAMALNPLSQREKLPLFGILGHSNFTTENSYAFQFWPSATVEGKMLAEKAVTLGKKAAVVSLEDEWPLSLAKQFKETFNSSSGETVFDISINPQERDFSSVAAKIRAIKADVIFVNMTISQAGLVIRKLREAGLRQPIVSNLYGSYPDTIAAAGNEAIEGLIFVAPSMERPRFKEAFYSQFPDVQPGAAAYSCYSALMALLEITLANPISDRNALYTQALQLKTAHLLDEDLPITDRQARYQLLYRSIHDGKIVDSLQSSSPSPGGLIKD